MTPGAPGAPIAHRWNPEKGIWEHGNPPTNSWIPWIEPGSTSQPPPHPTPSQHYPSEPHPVAASVLSVIGMFCLVAAAVDQFGHAQKVGYAARFWLVIGAIVIVISLILWLQVFLKRQK
jgi:hypothetical protein